MFEFLSQKFSGIFQWMHGKKTLTQENIAQAITQVKEALLQADVPLRIIDEFLSEVSTEIVGKQITSKTNPGDQFIKVVHDCLLRFLGDKQVVDLSALHKPAIIMVLGLQGSGKTTTIAKIARSLQAQAHKQNKTYRIVCGSVDFYRPAAIEQLNILAQKTDIAFYRAHATDALGAAQEIARYARDNKYDYLLLDTAGRLHVDDVMMQELVAVNERVQPTYKLFVLDTMTGQESLSVAQAFSQAVGFDAAILTKMDSQTRGGAAFAFRYALKTPIAFVGTGEKITDFEPFHPERMATRILGMGDLASLLERADELMDKQKQEDLATRLFDGSFSLDDFATQLSMVNKMGSLGKIVSYLPGMPKVSAQMLEQGQREMVRFRALLSSMTPQERKQPVLLNDRSRRRRIVKGAGCSEEELQKLMIRFEQSKQFARMYKKAGKFPDLF